MSGKTLTLQKPVFLVIGVLCVTLTSSAFQAGDRVTGVLIDLSCYSQDKDDSGNHHRNKGLVCAQACAREGFEVGVLTRDGVVYHVRGGLAAQSNAKLVPYMAQTVVITGKVSKEDGQMLIVSDDLEVSK